jgi:hypothetical protein
VSQAFSYQLLCAVTQEDVPAAVVRDIPWSSWHNFPVTICHGADNDALSVDIHAVIVAQYRHHSTHLLQNLPLSMEHSRCPPARCPRGCLSGA